MFQVSLRRFPVRRDSLEVKKIIKVKFLWIIAATAGSFHEWESVFLEKLWRYVFHSTLSLVVVPKSFHNGILCLYSSKRWQSVSWNKLDSLNLLLNLSFLTKPTYAKFCYFFIESHFQAKITTFYNWFYWFWISSLLVLNKFIEINTLIKRNLNFKHEVKSHKVWLQAYCNKSLLKWSYLYFSITWLHGYDVTSTRREVATRLLSKRCTCSRNLVTVAPPKMNIWVFVKIRALRANDVTTTLGMRGEGGLTLNILSKRCICCPRLVIIISLEVNYIIMVL